MRATHPSVLSVSSVVEPAFSFNHGLHGCSSEVVGASWTGKPNQPLDRIPPKGGIGGLPLGGKTIHTYDQLANMLKVSDRNGSRLHHGPGTQQRQRASQMGGGRASAIHLEGDKNCRERAAPGSHLSLSEMWLFGILRPRMSIVPPHAPRRRPAGQPAGSDVHGS